MRTGLVIFCHKTMYALILLVTRAMTMSAYRILISLASEFVVMGLLQLCKPGWELSVCRAHVVLASGLTEVVTAGVSRVVRAASPHHRHTVSTCGCISSTPLIPEAAVVRNGIIPGPSVRPSLYALETDESGNKMPRV